MIEIEDPNTLETSGNSGTNVYLLGMPSSGKSTLAKKLAPCLGYKSIDLDTALENQEGMSITQIFSTKGENYFREIERDILRRLPKNQSLVIATGGGSPCFYDNIEIIRASGLSVFLDVPVEDLVERIRLDNFDDRPLLSNVDSLADELNRKLNERRPYYVKAHITIAGPLDVQSLTETIQARLSQPG